MNFQLEIRRDFFIPSNPTDDHLNPADFVVNKNNFTWQYTTNDSVYLDIMHQQDSEAKYILFVSSQIWYNTIEQKAYRAQDQFEDDVINSNSVDFLSSTTYLTLIIIIIFYKRKKFMSN